MGILKELKELKDEQDKEILRLGDKWVETDRLEIEQSAYESADALRWLKEFCEKNEHLIIVVTKSIMPLL